MNGKHGSRNHLRYHKGESLRHYLRNLFGEFRYAWQRAWRGYDDSAIYDMAYNFAECMPTLLKEFKKNNDGLFGYFENGEYRGLTAEQTNAVLDEMIFYFESCDYDTVCKRLYGNKKLSEHEQSVLAEEHQRCWDRAFKLFATWSRCLWF